MTATSDKHSPNIIASLLVQHGIKDVVISPGSRNTPLILAIHAQPELRKTVVIDERSAAYCALGMTQSTGLPTAVVCTSGTALLNYAPAVAEAYYQGLPLIVISADRPLEWIDQDDSQTIRQPGVLHNFVKREYELQAYTDDPNMDRYAARCVNEAVLEATAPKQGPVHINVRLDEPLGRCAAERPVLGDCFARVTRFAPARELTVAQARELAAGLADKKVMVVAGFCEPDNRLNRYLSLLAKCTNVIILAETVSNLHIPDAITNIDAVLCRLTDEQREQMRPDVVITFGGAIVSRFIKQYLRTMPPEQNWRVGIDNNLIDCFLSLTMQIEMQPADFFARFSHAMLRGDSGADLRPARLSNSGGRQSRLSQNYKALCQSAYASAMNRAREYANNAPWSDLRAFDMIMKHLPRRCNLQLSNGTPIRYAQLFDNKHLHTCRCNRGVSGIDGCTSTAVGASMRSQLPTVLISGDMSFSYDINALAIRDIPASFRAIVLNNSGGGIFRFIRSTSALETREQYFSVKPKGKLSMLAEAYGLGYLRAENEQQLAKALAEFYRPTDTPVLLEIVTPPDTSAEVLTNFFL